VNTTITNLPQRIIELHIPCPNCPSSDAYCIYDDGHGYCYSCGYYKNGNNVLENTSEVSYEFIPWRGVSADTFRFYQAATKVSNTGEPIELGFRYPNGSYKIRSRNSKRFYSKGDISKAGLFGRNLFTAGSHKTLIITEGELDACSVWQVVRSPVVSVHSASSARTDVGLDRSWCNSFERIVLAFDADEAGRDAARAVASLFDYTKVYSVSFGGENRKDANDYLRNGEADELAAIIANARKFLPDEIKSSFSDFEKILNEEPKLGVPYPFPTLNFMTYGIRTGESVLITAQEGIGKTEVMHTILHQLLRETNDNIGTIFLEEPKQRLLQAIAGISLRKPCHLPDSGVSNTETLAALKNLVRVDERLHVYSHFGSDDPDSILDTIRFMVAARGCRRVLFDHITMGVSAIGGKEERIALDYLSTRLEMMVKELDFSLIMVSHVNDDGLTRGSRNISKIADIRIDLDRDIKHPDPTIRRLMHVMVSKNRYCGRTGPAGSLLFDPLTYTLSEDLGYVYEQNPTPANDNTISSTTRVA
jgi:twinkle protein